MLISILFCLLAAVPGIMAQEVPMNHADAGVTVLVPDLLIAKSDVDMGSYWEPFTDIFGDGTIAVIAGCYAEGTTSGTMNAKVVFIDMEGNVSEYWAFYDDAGNPYTGPFNEARKDGNPPRIACDRRSGSTTYVTGQEATPYLYDEFNSDGRWEKSFVYTQNQIAAVQFFNLTDAGPVPFSNVIDPVYGAGDIEGAQSGQMRFGGEIRILSNGNILVVPEDRNGGIISGNAAIATIFDGETGEIIKGPFNAPGDEASHSIWSNVAAFNGGFAVRSEGVMTMYTNDGELMNWVLQEEWTNVADAGRGDGTRIASNITSDYIYILGKDNVVGDMIISRINAQTGAVDNTIDDVEGHEGHDTVIANEVELWDVGDFDRGDIAVDMNGNICVTYEFEDSGFPELPQMVARIFNSDMEPVTPTFYAFENHDTIDDIKGILAKEVNVSMDNQRIVIAADGVTVDPDSGELTPNEQAYAVVLANPLSTSVAAWELF